MRGLTTLEASFLVLMAAFGIALKPIVGPMARLINSAAFIPAGTVAGAIYMMWPLLALLVIGRFGAATLTGLIEGIVILVTGLYGSHGCMSLLIYALPCLVMDAVFLLVRAGGRRWLLFFPAAAANLTGTALVGAFIMRIPLLPLAVSLVPAFVFGGLGGLLAARMYGMLIGTFPQFRGNHRFNGS